MAEIVIKGTGKSKMDLQSLRDQLNLFKLETL